MVKICYGIDMLDKKEITNLRTKGWTYEEIAKYYGLTRQRIHQKLTGYKTKGSIKYQERQRRYIRDFSKKYNRLIREKRKSLVLSHYGNGNLACVKCGFNDVRALSIDHINDNGTEHRKKIGCNIYLWLITNEFPPGYQTLCMNCQFIKRFRKPKPKK